jgi:hypothetical protein
MLWAYDSFFFFFFSQSSQSCLAIFSIIVALVVLIFPIYSLALFSIDGLVSLSASYTSTSNVTDHHFIFFLFVHS